MECSTTTGTREIGSLKVDNVQVTLQGWEGCCSLVMLMNV